jgi:pSer/pThr/pTyr-binding forkhead associated (FHA) protein
VGGDPRADLPLLDAQVSKRHAYLQVIGGRVFCLDLGSRTGTRWGAVNQPSGWLLRGRSLGVGPYEIRLHEDDSLPRSSQEGTAELPHPLEVSAAARDDLASCILEAHNLPSRPVWSLNRTLTLVGRAPECPIALAEQGLWRFHCLLFRTRGGVWAVDLRGNGGIAVNGKGMRWAHLHEGDDLRMGRVAFRVRFGSTQPLVQPWAMSVDTTAGTRLTRLPEPRPLVPGRPAELLLRTIVQQFDALRQEMRDQMQRTLMELVKAFAAGYGDRTERVRLEGEPIRQRSDPMKARKERAPQIASRNQVTAPDPAA